MKNEIDMSNRNFVGVDLHCDQMTCCFLNQDNSERKDVYHLNEGGLAQFRNEIDDNSHLIVEASTSTFAFTEAVSDIAGSVTIVDARKMQLIFKDKKKTDKVDAKKLAIYLKMQMSSGYELIRPVYKPEKGIQELRSLFVTYKMFMKQLVQLKNRIHALTRQNLLSYRKQNIFRKETREEILAIDLPQFFKNQMAFLYQYSDTLQNQIEEIKDQVYLAGEKYKVQIDLLTSIKGISVFTALALISDIADIGRFKNEKHLASYLRSTPSVDSSNSVTRVGKTSKLGRKLSITLLTQSVTHFRNGNPNLQSWVDKHAEKSRGKIRMALCRKLICIVYHMLKNGELYRHMDEANHAEKLNEYARFLKKEKKIA